MKTTPTSAAEALDRLRGLARAAWSRLQRDDLGDEANAAAAPAQSASSTQQQLSMAPSSMPAPTPLERTAFHVRKLAPTTSVAGTVVHSQASSCPPAAVQPMTSVASGLRTRVPA